MSTRDFYTKSNDLTYGDIRPIFRVINRAQILFTHLYVHIMFSSFYATNLNEYDVPFFYLYHAELGFWASLYYELFSY